MATCPPPDHPLFLFHAQLGEPCCLRDHGIRHSIKKTSAGRDHSASDDFLSMFRRLFSKDVKCVAAIIPESFSAFASSLFPDSSLSLFFYLPSSGLFFQPPLFPHQIPSLHNYHLLILNESSNTLHGFNTAC